MAATETVNALRERLKQRRVLLCDTDGIVLLMLNFDFYFSVVSVLFLVLSVSMLRCLDLLVMLLNLQLRGIQGRWVELRLALDRRIWCVVGHCRGIRER